MQQKLYIISDIHLGQGDTRDDFVGPDEHPDVHDAALAAFFEMLAAQPPITLVINGDFIDFVQIQFDGCVSWCGPRFDSTEAVSVRKLNAAIAAHPQVFDALALFVHAGHTLRIHYGNHDPDLNWPAVRERLIERFGGECVRAQISFGARYHGRGVYIEHGNNIDQAQRFDWDAPDILSTCPDDNQQRLQRNWGNRMVQEFWNEVEGLDDFMTSKLDNSRPTLHGAILAMLYFWQQRDTDPRARAVLDKGMLLMHQIVETFDHDDIEGVARTFDTPEWAIRAVFVLIGWWTKDAPDLVPLNASAHTRSHADLQRIQALPVPDTVERRATASTPPPVPPVTHRPSQHAFIGQIEQAWGVGGAISDEAELDGVLDRLADSAYHSVASGIDFLIEPLRSFTSLFSERTSADVCHAEQLAEQFAAQVVALGHTHRALAHGFRTRAHAAQYVNSGTWMPTFHLQWNTRPAELFDAQRYVSDYDYVEISWDAWSDEPQASLKQWSAEHLPAHRATKP